MEVPKGLGDTSIRYKELTGWNWKTMKKSFTKRFPAQRDMTLSSTLNSTHPCPMCRTTKWNEIHHTNGAVTIKTCSRCKGKGEIRY